MKRVGTLRWGILALVTLGTMVNYLDRNTLSVLAPVLKDDLKFTTEQYSYVVTDFQATDGLMQPIAGYITDCVGLRTSYTAFALLWGAACALHAVAGSWTGPAGFRALLAVGEGAAIPSGVKWLVLRERQLPIAEPLPRPHDPAR